MMNQMKDDGFCADLIIVGGGLAGLTAGVRAAQLGLRPLVLEQGTSEDYACNSRMSGGILHIGFHDPYRPAHELVGIIDRLTNNEAKPELARALAHTGARLLAWLEDQGGKFMRFSPQEGYRWCLSPPRALRAGMDWERRGPDLLLRQMAKTLADLGGRLQLGARVQRLLFEDDHCVGAQGLSAGQETEWRARYCILADGGFQASRQLVEKYITTGFDCLFQRGAATGMGDGLTMAQAAGAALTDCSSFYGHLLCSDAKHNDQVWPYPEIDAIATSGIVVDASGCRCVDEGRTGVGLANELARRGGNNTYFVVFDASIWEGPGTSARIPANPLLERAGGTILRADSIAELAQKMGVPQSALVQTVEQYNRALQSGQMDILTVPRSDTGQQYVIRNGPFMAIPVCPGITYTMGGIDINADAEVLDEEGRPIKGLFAAGATTGGLEGGSHATYLGGLIKAGCFGLLAAERIAKLEGKTILPEDHSRTGLRNDRKSSGDIDAVLGGNRARTPPAELVHGLARFPILNMVVRHGRTIGAVTSLVMAAVVIALGWNWLSWFAIPLAALLAAVAYVVVLGVAELVSLVTEFLMPQ